MQADLEAAIALEEPRSLRRSTLRLLLLLGHRPVIVIGVLAVLKGVADGLFGGMSVHDPRLFASAGSALLSPRGLHAFADPLIQTGPLQLLFSGFAAVVSEPDGTSRSVLLSLMTQPLIACGSVFVTLKMTGDRAWNGVAAFAVGFGALMIAATWAPFVSGQTAEGLLPLLWLLCGWFAARDQPIGAGLMLGLAAAWKPTGLLGCGLLLLTRRPRNVVAAASVALGITVLAYGPFAIAGDFNMFGFSWPVDIGSSLQDLYRLETTLPWWVRILHGGAVVGLTGAAAILMRGRPEASWTLPTAVAAARVAFDPAIIWYWYWVPIQLAGLVTAAFVLLQGRSIDSRVLSIALIPLLLLEPGRTPALAVMGVTFLLCASLVREPEVKKGVATSPPRPLPSPRSR